MIQQLLLRGNGSNCITCKWTRCDDDHLSRSTFAPGPRSAVLSTRQYRIAKLNKHVDVAVSRSEQFAQDFKTCVPSSCMSHKLSLINNLQPEGSSSPLSTGRVVVALASSTEVPGTDDVAPMLLSMYRCCRETQTCQR